MPLLLKKNISEHLSLAVWQITESKEELTTLLGDKMISEVKSDVTTSKLIQRLASRMAVKSVCGEIDLVYDSYGKLQLKSQSGHISVSHTLHYAAAIFNRKKSVGIDIEQIRSTAVTIRNKFLSTEEIDALQNQSDAAELTLYWCCKEAIYKLYGKKEVLFAEHMRIKPVVLGNSGSIQAGIAMAGLTMNLELRYEKIQDHWLVYTI